MRFICWEHSEIEMELKEAIYTRRSVRDFTPEPVDEKAIRDLIDAAVAAPSAVNAQPAILRRPRQNGARHHFAGSQSAHGGNNSGSELMSHHFSELLNDPKFDIFYHAPALILICAVADIPWAVEDCALAAVNLMLAARSSGLWDESGLNTRKAGWGRPRARRS